MAIKKKVVSLVKKVSKKYADNYSPGGMYKPTRNKKKHGYKEKK